MDNPNFLPFSTIPIPTSRHLVLPNRFIKQTNKPIPTLPLWTKAYHWSREKNEVVKANNQFFIKSSSASKESKLVELIEINNEKEENAT